MRNLKKIESRTKIVKILRRHNFNILKLKLSQYQKCYFSFYWHRLIKLKYIALKKK